MGYFGQERRKNKRLPELFFVKWQQDSKESPKNWTTAYLKNISRSGLAMQCSQKLVVGDKLNLLVTVHVETAPCMCAGQVIWIQKTPDKLGYEVGVAFTSIDNKDADWIDVLAEEFERRAERERGETAT